MIKPSVTTERLVVLLQQKDRTGYSLLYDQYSGTLLGILYKIVGDEQISEDLLQDVFVKVWKHIGSFDVVKGTFFTWLLNITRNSAIDYLRSRTYKNHQLQMTCCPGDIASQHAAGINVECIGLKKIVGILDRKYLEIIDMIYFMGHTQEDIASILDLPLGTVKTRTRMALKILRQFYGNE